MLGEELKANTVDAAVEKHVPVIGHPGDSVTISVGSVAHPMLPEHYIQFIVLETATGYQIKHLKPGEAPKADFAVTEPVIAAYEYCNLHGLWMAKAYIGSSAERTDMRKTEMKKTYFYPSRIMTESFWI